MKDQVRLLRDCVINEIPAIVFQGGDSCAVEVLESAIEIYRRHGCNEEFLFDFQQMINDFKAYQKMNPHKVKLAKMTPTEMELVREEMQKKGIIK